MKRSHKKSLDVKDDLFDLLSKPEKHLVDFSVFGGNGRNVSVEDIKAEIRSALLQVKNGNAVRLDRIPMPDMKPVDVRTLIGASDTIAAE